MHKILLLIGHEAQPYSTALASKGHAVISFDAPEQALPRLPEASFVILQSIIHKEPLKKFLAASKGIPKLFITKDVKADAALLKEPLTYQLQTPTKKELFQFLRRLAAEQVIYEENRMLKERGQGFERDLKFFEDLGHNLTSSAENTDVLPILIKQIKAKTGADTCTIYLMDEETGSLVMERTEGSLRDASGGPPLKAADNIAAWVAREGKPILIKNVFKDVKFHHKLDRDIRHKIKSVICLPIKSKNKTLGVLELINKQADQEFTQKDFNFITRFICQVAIVIERSILYEKMQELVITDDLTKLFNTRYMTRTIETEVLRSNRYNTSVSLIFMDIDFFKEVNDSYGHLVGSRVLVEIGQLLIKHLRDVDIVARYGGDEFVIILPHTPPQRAVKIAERIRQTIEQHYFLRKEGYNLRLTASFGVASYPESAQSKEDLLRLADEAMYKVKRKARNGVYAIGESGPF